MWTEFGGSETRGEIQVWWLILCVNNWLAQSWDRDGDLSSTCLNLVFLESRSLRQNFYGESFWGAWIQRKGKMRKNRKEERRKKIQVTTALRKHKWLLRHTGCFWEGYVTSLWLQGSDGGMEEASRLYLPITCSLLFLTGPSSFPTRHWFPCPLRLSGKPWPWDGFQGLRVREHLLPASGSGRMKKCAWVNFTWSSMSPDWGETKEHRWEVTDVQQQI